MGYLLYTVDKYSIYRGGRCLFPTVYTVQNKYVLHGIYRYTVENIFYTVGHMNYIPWGNSYIPWGTRFVPHGIYSIKYICSPRYIQIYSGEQILYRGAHKLYTVWKILYTVGNPIVSRTVYTTRYITKCALRYIECYTRYIATRAAIYCVENSPIYRGECYIPRRCRAEMTYTMGLIMVYTVGDKSYTVGARAYIPCDTHL